ncbi:hypothetical protein QE152_g33594 [Popillia japonica]|uniref:Reverse transcriptase n=1 Tax=Popillia japonica TaxID=7064 RepID=A0AAW1IWR4_POPJA
MYASSVNDALITFTDTLWFYIDTSFRKKKSNLCSVNRRKPWITKCLLVSYNNLKNIYRQEVTSQTPQGFDFYRQYIHRKVITAAKGLHHDGLMTGSTNKSKIAWKIIIDLTSHKTKTAPNFISYQQSTTNDPVEITNYFVNIYNTSTCTNVKDSSATHCDILTMFLDSVSADLVYSVLCGLKSSTAVGVDGIRVDLLKRCAQIVK